LNPSKAVAEAAQLEKVERCRQIQIPESSRRRQKPIFEFTSV
jgi:hypothetical protein